MTLLFYAVWFFTFLFGLLFGWFVLSFSQWMMKRNHILYGPVFIPTKDEDLETMMTLAGIKTGEKVADLGSGNGKIVMALAQQGFDAHGFENSPSLVVSSRWRIKRLDAKRKGVDQTASGPKRPQIHWQDFWHADLSKFDVIMMYTSQDTMDRLEKHIQQQLKPGARVVSNTFQFPTWKETKQKGKIFLYKKV